MKRKILLYAIFGLMLLLLPHETSAVQLITNGGFETGNFTGWTTISAPNSIEPWTVSGSGNGSTFPPASLPATTTVIQGSFNAWVTIGSDAGSSSLTQDVAIPAGMRVQFTWLDKYQMNLSNFCSSAATCGTASYRVEIVNPTTNVLLQTLYIVNTNSLSNTNTGWVSHIVNLTAYSGQTIRIRFRTNVTVNNGGPGRAEIDGVTMNAFPPSAASATLGGRVLSADGIGISRANVTLTNGAGVSRSVTTNSFGYYRFDEVPVGETYIVEVNSKKYLFTDSPRVVNVQDNITDADFRASP
jgi:hypothetical protein